MDFKVGDKVRRLADEMSSCWERRCEEIGAKPNDVAVVTSIDSDGDLVIEFDGKQIGGGGGWHACNFEIAVVRGRPKKIKPDNLVRYMLFGTGCSNKSNLFREETELKDYAKAKSTDSDWSGELVGYKLTPMFKVEKAVRFVKVK